MHFGSGVVPPTQDVMSLSSFIGAYKILAPVIKGYATALGPLDDAVAVQESKEEGAWSEEFQSAFAASQKMLSTARPITLPQSEDQLWIATDGAVKDAGLGAKLYITNKGRCYFSAKLRPNQTSWLQCEVEALFIGAAVKHFSPIITKSLHRVCVLMDSKPCVQAFDKLCRGEFSASPRVT